MSSSQKKAIRNAHARKYIEEVFANRLKEEGFFCPDDRLLCWYRILNNEVLQTICFYSCWSNVPLIVSIAYGVNPLFKKPFATTDVSSPKRPDGAGFSRAEIRADGEKQWMAPYAPDAQVYAPIDGSRGRHTLEENVFPLLNSIQTLAQCYRLHLDSPQRYDISYAKSLADMGIYLQDDQNFSLLLNEVDDGIRRCDWELERRPKSSEHAKLKQEYLLLREVLRGNDRSGYVAVLEAKKQKTLQALKK